MIRREQDLGVESDRDPKMASGCWFPFTTKPGVPSKQTHPDLGPYTFHISSIIRRFGRWVLQVHGKKVLRDAAEAAE